MRAERISFGMTNVNHSMRLVNLSIWVVKLMKLLSERKIINLFNQNKLFNEIANIVQRSQSIVQSIINKFKDTEGIQYAAMWSSTETV